MQTASLPRGPSVGDLRRLVVTVPQAARILKLEIGQVRKAIDRRVVVAVLARRGNRRIRTLDGVDVLCLRMREVLKHDVRQTLYARLKHAPESERLDSVFDDSDPRWMSGFLHDSATETVADMRSLHESTRAIDAQGRLRGGEVEAHRIAALVAGGMSVADVLEDYPGLDTDQVAAAVAYARTHPKPGRPYPARTAKSVLRNGGGGGLAAAFAAARADEE